jgi:hypothetical protein
LPPPPIGTRLRRVKLLAVVFTLGGLGAAGEVSAQTAVELRGSTTRYRFVDVNHTFPSGVMLDALYLGVPGQNELYLGGGYAWKAARALTVIPLVYGVAGRENGERGVALCAYVLGDAGPWKAVAFVGRFVRASGDVATYDFVDSVDVTRKAAGRWDVGLSSTIYRQEVGWSHYTGPMARRSDARGSWALSVRAGYDTEVRLVRVLTFGRP